MPARRPLPHCTLFTGDNLQLMRRAAGGSVDLIYLDPPFNSRRHHRAPGGAEAAGAAFRDAWTPEDARTQWQDELESARPGLAQLLCAVARRPGDRAYLLYMAVRLLQMHRLLKPEGSIYLHCDPTMSHALKLLMDAIFGDGGADRRAPGFRNEIAWCYGLGGSSRRYYPRKHDTIFWYSKGARWFFNPPMVPATSRKLRGRQKKCPDHWNIPALNNMSKERTGYPTQKPLALLHRIIAAGSPPGSFILDPFCGSATTLLAAQLLHRRWCGADLSPHATHLAARRLTRESPGCQVALRAVEG